MIKIYLVKKIIFFLFITITSTNIYALNIGSVTKLEIPRFVSLKSDDSNLRIGSSLNYPITLKYTSKNFPLKIIDEYDVWRKTKDIEGNEGWIHKSLLKGNRYAIINQPYENGVQVFNKPMGKINGIIGKNNIVQINTCLIEWCLIKYNNFKGWVSKKNLWGVNQDEEINIPFYQFIINQFWKINF